MSEFAVVSHADIKTNLHGFFTGIGWTVTGTVAEPIVRPVGGTKDFVFTVGGSATFTVSDATDSNFAAMVLAPINTGNTVGVVTHKTPTRIFAYGETDWAAIIIQYGFNLYRHIYMGKLQLFGNATGGDILSCTNFRGINAASRDLSSTIYGFQFAGSFTGAGSNDYIATPVPHGSVFVQHADLSNQVKKFTSDNRSPSMSSTGSAMDIDVALGGFAAPIEMDRRVANAPVPGGVVLLPYTIYCTNRVPPNMEIIPLGTPPGIFSTNISGIDPESNNVVAGVTYKSFPEMSKEDTGVTVRAAGDYYLTQENSLYAGLSYKVVG